MNHMVDCMCNNVFLMYITCDYGSYGTCDLSIVKIAGGEEAYHFSFNYRFMVCKVWSRSPRKQRSCPSEMCFGL